MEVHKKERQLKVPGRKSRLKSFVGGTRRAALQAPSFLGA